MSSVNGHEGGAGILVAETEPLLLEVVPEERTTEPLQENVPKNHAELLQQMLSKDGTTIHENTRVVQVPIIDKTIACELAYALNGAPGEKGDIHREMTVDCLLRSRSFLDKHKITDNFGKNHTGPGGRREFEDSYLKQKEKLEKLQLQAAMYGLTPLEAEAFRDLFWRMYVDNNQLSRNMLVPLALGGLHRRFAKSENECFAQAGDRAYAAAQELLREIKDGKRYDEMSLEQKSVLADLAVDTTVAFLNGILPDAARETILVSAPLELRGPAIDSSLSSVGQTAGIEVLEPATTEQVWRLGQYALVCEV